MSNKCNCQIPNTDLTGRCFKCGGTIESPADVQKRIKADAEKAIKVKDWGESLQIEMYIAGATAENDRAQVLTERLGIALENIYKIHSHLWSEFDRKEITSILEQWKSGKGKEAKVYRPCPHCGKELFRDRNLCCRACGKEVGDEICGICKDKPMGDGLTVCNECYEKFDGDRRGFWKGDVYQ